MWGETNEESEIDNGERGAAAAGGSRERRASHEKLQSITSVSQSPSHNLYKNGPRDLLHPTPQRGVGDAWSKTNPFHARYLESSGKRHEKEDMGRETLRAYYDGSLPPADYETPSLDAETEIEPAENGGRFQTSTFPRNTSANYRFRDETLNAADLFKPVSLQTRSLSETRWPKSADRFTDLSPAAEGEDSRPVERTGGVSLFHKSSNGFVDPLESLSKKEEDLFRSPRPSVAKPFDAAAINSPDLFQAVPPKSEALFHTRGKRFSSTQEGKEDLFDMSSKNNLYSPPSTKTSDSFQSPVTRDLFSDFSSVDDPFAATPSKQYNPFQHAPNGTPDVFQPLPPKTTGKGVFELTPRNTDSTPSLSRGPEMKLDVFPSSPDPFREASSSSSNTACDADDVLQPTPFTRARNLCISPGQSPSDMTHVSAFRRPPKPLPRKRTRKEKPPVSEKPPVPEKPPVSERLMSEKPPVPEKPPVSERLMSEKPPVPEKPPVSEILMSEKPPVPEKPPVSERLMSEKPPVPEKPPVSERLMSEKPPVPEKPPTPAKHVEPESTVVITPPEPAFRPLPKPPCKPKTPESKPEEPENYVVLQEILFTGQEKCVEDWPEDSPQLRPDFKPSGTFKLRRESLKMKTDSEGGSGEDQDGLGSLRKKKSLKKRMSALSRRGSKVNEGMQHAKEGRKSSKEYYSDAQTSAGENDEEEQSGADGKRKPLKSKVSHLLRRTSAAATLEGRVRNGHVPQESKDNSQDEILGAGGYTTHTAFQAASMDDEDLCASAGLNDGSSGMEACKPKTRKHKVFSPIIRKPRSSSGQCDLTGYQAPSEASIDVFAESNLPPTAEDFTSPGDACDVLQDGFETTKPKKRSKLKGLIKYKIKRRGNDLVTEVPPEASSSEILSEAARLEWLSALRDERGVSDLENDEEDGDTDSLMEWWYTVEQWDELSSDDEDRAANQDAFRSFTVLADKVNRGLRVFNRVFTERAEVLWQYIIMLHAIADDIRSFHQKAIVAGVTGGTTTAVGGATALAGLVLAPFTFGFSLIITAVGMGVATAGGITTASAAISDSVNNMHDRKKVEIILLEYETHLLDIGKVLHFLNQGLYRIRGHPFLRSGTQHYSEDWEVRRAVQIISLVDSPVMRATEITDSAVSSVQVLFKGMDKYFTKDTRELRKGWNHELVTRIKGVANVLNGTIMELNDIKEEVLQATGGL